MTEPRQDTIPDAYRGPALLAGLALVVGNFIAGKLAWRGILEIFPGLATEPFDKGIIAAALVFVVLLNCRP